MDFQARKRYYNRCKPNEPLPPNDERYLDLDALPAPHPRGGSWRSRLATRIELADAPLLQLATGLPGTGKSTELLRLQERLQDPRRAHLLTVYIDAEDEIDISQPIDVPDVLAVVVHQCERRVLEVEGKDAGNALLSGYITRFWNWLNQTDVVFNQAEFKVSDAVTLTAELKTRPNLRRKVREIVGQHLPAFLSDVAQELKGLDTRARLAGYNGLAVIFDSLEKLRGISTNWESVLQSAEQTFGSGTPYLQLPVHVIYTVPAALITRQVGKVEFLPMIKLRNRDGSRFDEGCEAMIRLARLRIDEEGLKSLLGDKHESRLKTIIEQTGGYPREMFETLQALLEVPELPVKESDLNRRFAEIRDRFQAATTLEDLPWLARVGCTHELQIKDDGHRDPVDRALRNHLVLRYANDDVWYDLHPAVRAMAGVKQFLKLDPGEEKC